MEDLLLDINDQQLQITGGDFATGEATLQHQDLLIMTNPGEWKESPTIAVGALGFLKDEDMNGLLGKVKEQLEKDGMTVSEVSIQNGNLYTNAQY